MNKKTILGIAIFSVLILIAIAISISALGSAQDDSEKNNILINVPQGVKIQTYISCDTTHLIVEVTNNTGKLISEATITATYYDENNEEIAFSFDYETFYLLEDGKKTICKLDLPDGDEYQYKIPTKTELEFEINNERTQEMDSNLNKLSYEYNDENEEKIQITIKNNAEKEMCITKFAVVFYKSGKPIYVHEEVNMFFRTIKSGEEYIAEFYRPEYIQKYYETGKTVYIEYDSIQIFRLNQL